MTSSISHHLSCIVSVHDGRLGVHIDRSLCGEVWNRAARVLASHVVGSDIQHTYELISQVWSAFLYCESCCEAEKKSCTQTGVSFTISIGLVLIVRI